MLEVRVESRVKQDDNNPNTEWRTVSPSIIQSNITNADSNYSDRQSW